jgi:hypothetical protein
MQLLIYKLGVIPIKTLGDFRKHTTLYTLRYHYSTIMTEKCGL